MTTTNTSVTRNYNAELVAIVFMDFHKGTAQWDNYPERFGSYVKRESVDGTAVRDPGGIGRDSWAAMQLRSFADHMNDSPYTAGTYSRVVPYTAESLAAAEAEAKAYKAKYYAD